MFSKTVVCIYASLFLFLTICNSGMSAEGPTSMLRPQSPGEKPGGGIIWTFEDYGRLIVVRVDKMITKAQNMLTKANTKVTGMLSKTSSGASSVPSRLTNTLLTLGTFGFGRGTVVIAGILEAVNQNATGQKVIKFGSGVSECYKTNKKNVFKTALTSITTCAGEESETIVKQLNVVIAALQMFVMNVEMNLQEMQDCSGPKCNVGAAKALAKRTRLSVIQLMKSLAQTAKTVATLGPKGAKCFGTKTGINTAQEFGEMVKDFSKCVQDKM